MEQIDAYAEPDEMEATNIPNAQDLLGGDLHFLVADQQQPEAHGSGPRTSRGWLTGLVALRRIVKRYAA